MPEDKIVAEACTQLASIFHDNLSDKTIADEQADFIWLACLCIAKSMRITLTKPPAVSNQTLSVKNYLQRVAQASHFRLRQVTLSDRWWCQDSGPLLAFDRATQKPFALIVDQKGHYHRFDPQDGQTILVTPQGAKHFAVSAFSFYRTLPDGPLNLKTLFKFVVTNQKHDLVHILILQFLIGLVGLFVPIATGVILDNAVPNASTSLLWQFTYGLLASVFAGAAFSAAQVFGFIRFRFKSNVAAQAAVWDRLLRLAPNFFRKFSPGDLTMRASGIDLIQQEITGAVIQGILGGIFSVLTLILMLYYSFQLTLAAIVFLAILVLLIWLNAGIQLKFQRPIAKLQGELANLTFKFLNNIAKLRVTGSESRAFVLWTKKFAAKSRLFFAASRWNIRFILARTFFSVLILIGLYSFVGSGIAPITFGHFIAFNAAFGQFFAAILALAGITTTMIRIVPLYERIQPILTAEPELTKERQEVGVLSGRIEIKQVSFRYHPEQPYALEKISMQIDPGEFVAFVGSTGSGKSTLFRLLLGFETPSAGAIYYDGKELASLNLTTLREQLGVVLQNSTLFPGTIFDNVAGAHSFTMEEVWEALRQAELVSDIEAMPMGIHTLVTEGGRTLSVGQRQRLMIARALIRKPKILLFDEAVSVVDNPTQEKIIEHLKQSKLTQLWIAHRINTIKHADKICLLSEGKIAHIGTYTSFDKKRLS